MNYIYQNEQWPQFQWNAERLSVLLATIHNKQGRVVGRKESLGFNLRSEAILHTLTLNILKSNEIEGEILNRDQVRSSLARHLGLDIAGLIPSDRHIDGVVEMMLDATQQFAKPLSSDRLFGWHACMFPAGRSGLYKITTADWRKGPVFVVSGRLDKEEIHFEGPPAAIVDEEMNKFLTWFNGTQPIDPVIKAAIAHLWFLTLHPFDDGNGRIARAIADLQLARADGTAQRFYSMSAQIQKERNTYYRILEATQRASLDITTWLEWFLQCLDRSLSGTDTTLNSVLIKARFWELHAGTKLNERQHMMLNRLLDGFEGKLNTAKWAKIAKCSHDTALRDIQDLIDKHILQKDEAGGRSTSYILHAI